MMSMAFQLTIVFRQLKKVFQKPFQDLNETNQNGFEIFSVKGWDYPNLITLFQKAGEIARTHHVPVLIHVTELTQPRSFHFWFS
ncbi:MAG: hypothetical protein CM15mP59_5840 [Flavobacteriaceae bacterium]|nr:MAG: hypothetical protein CM15mP59_5840 [Flavobacteriaceae bacterium]